MINRPQIDPANSYRALDTFVALGDSLTLGRNCTTPRHSWVGRLKTLIDDYQAQPVTAINSGIGGNVISPRSSGYKASGKPSGMERLEEDVIRHRPDLLIVAYGVNDCRAGTPATIFSEELVSLIRTIRASINPIFVLTGPFYIYGFEHGAPNWSHATPADLRTYNQTIRTIANEHHCLFVDLLLAFGDADTLVSEDGVHANDLGHHITANRIFECLAKNAVFSVSRCTSAGSLLDP